MKKLRIVFMGTPEFAVPSLKILVENYFNIVGVVTAPDKPQGRGQKISYSPVKEVALQHNLPILQPTNLKSTEFLDQLRALNANLQVVVAFRMLPEAVWSMPELGTFNLHASLLPQYRGAAPINWAIINGEKETGVTTFFLQHEIDTGEIIMQEPESITPEDTAGTLYERLMNKGADLVLETTRLIERGKVVPRKQHISGTLKHAPKIFRETCEINWTKTTQEIIDFVRGLSPYPASWTTIQAKTYKVFAVSKGSVEEGSMENKLVTDNKSYLCFRTADGWVSIDELQPEGKKRMSIRDFFLGNKIAP